MITQESIASFVLSVPSNIVNSINSIKERGVGHYQRPLLIAAASMAVVYFLVYKSPTENLQRSQSEISRLTAIAQYTGRFGELKNLLVSYYANLPKVKDKDRSLWLTNIVRESMKAEGVSFISMSPVAEQTQGYYAQESLNITCGLSYKQLASWIARLESSSDVIRISNLNLAKDGSEIGMNKVELTISAVFPIGGDAS